ncbi:MAG: hypothetical protein JNM67_09590 [Bacteroidetes bacterium]|nr:hypothetical protein [Bacteroidota bacterium]
MFRYSGFTLDLALHNKKQLNNLPEFKRSQKETIGYYINFGWGQIQPINKYHHINFNVGALYNVFSNNQLIENNISERSYGYRYQSVLFHVTPELSLKLSERFWAGIGLRVPLYQITSKTYKDEESKFFDFGSNKIYPLNFSYSSIQLNFNYCISRKWDNRKRFSF